MRVSIETASANGGWLRRLVRPIVVRQLFDSIPCRKMDTALAAGEKQTRDNPHRQHQNLARHKGQHSRRNYRKSWTQCGHKYPLPRVTKPRQAPVTRRKQARTSEVPDYERQYLRPKCRSLTLAANHKI